MASSDKQEPQVAFPETVLSFPQTEDDEEEWEELEDIEAAEVLQWLPYLVKHVFAITLGLVFIGIPIVILVYVGPVKFTSALSGDIPNNATNSLIGAYRAVRGLAFICAMYILITIISFFLGVFPRMLLRVTGWVAPGYVEWVKHCLEFYNALLLTIKVLVSTATTFALWCLAFPATVTFDPSLGIREPKYILFRAVFCFFVVSVILSLEKFILQCIAIRFHRTAYKQRLDDSNYATYVLDSLNKARKSIKHKKLSMSQPKFLTHNMRNESYSSAKAATQSTSNIYNNVNKTVFEGRYEDDVDLHSKTEARILARKIFSSLQGKRGYLILDDFYPIFPSPEEAKKAFDFFDKDGNGDISKREMREQISMVYKERKDLTIALRDTSQAVGKLDWILLIIFLLISGFACAAIFGAKVVDALIPFGTLFVGLAFIFGESAKELFQSIIFLFVMHPYDAGDRVYIESDNLLVVKVGLLGTKFNHINGQVTYIPHSILMKKVIYNIRRSTSQAEDVDFQVDFDTPKEKIIALKERVNRYIEQEESREFHGNVLLGLREIVDSNKLNLFIWLEHKGNWQDGGKRWARKTRFMIALREICQELDLRYSLLPQKIEHINPPPYLQNSR